MPHSLVAQDTTAQNLTSSEAPPWFSGSATSQKLMAAVAETWEDTSTSQQYLQEALANPAVELDVLIGAYRYYFYKNQNALALEIATTVTERLRHAEQWPTCWDDLKLILVDHLDEPNVRLYLNAYSASGLLFARLGQVDKAQAIANQVQQIQSKEFGAEVLHSILNPVPEDDED